MYCPGTPVLSQKHTEHYQNYSINGKACEEQACKLHATSLHLEPKIPARVHKDWRVKYSCLLVKNVLHLLFFCFK